MVASLPRLDVVAGGGAVTRSDVRAGAGQYGQASQAASMTWPFGQIRIGAFGFDFQNHAILGSSPFYCAW
jgi:hypothetical protein